MTLYIRPTHYIDSPQQYDGKTERLAGTLLWFAHIEIIEKTNQDVRRISLPLDDWDEHIERYSDAQSARLNILYQNLISPREALSLGSKDTPKFIRFDQPHVMGILNITPDSFSDGGQYSADESLGIDHGYAMASAGASLIDIGGESTRPGAKTLWEGDEAARILPAIKALAANMIVSVDTRKAGVMEQGLANGAAIINDISALGYDKRSLEVVRDNGAPLIIMHAPSQGDNPHENAQYEDILFDVFDWLEKRVLEIEAEGISRSKIMIDPGIGFGKNLNENIGLINKLSMFHAIGSPIVFGASRKRLIGALANEEAADKRLGGSLLLAIKAIEQGAHIVRVHDVPETVQAIRVWRGMRDAALTEKA